MAPGKASAKEPLKIGFIGAFSIPYGSSNKTALQISVEELGIGGGATAKK